MGNRVGYGHLLGGEITGITKWIGALIGANGNNTDRAGLCAGIDAGEFSDMAAKTGFAHL